MKVRRITLSQAEKQLTQRIKDGHELLRRSTAIKHRDGSDQLEAQFDRWHNYNSTWLKTYLNFEVFEEYEDTVEDEEDRASGRPVQQCVSAALRAGISELESIQERLPLLLPESEAKNFGSHASHDAPIFIVHGSDTLRAESVAHAVTSATGRKTIILRDEPNSGRTLIEKFEQHAAEVSYAIIVLTADDKGSRADEAGTRPRGRQNVIFEMGYFYGLIGRDRVSVLRWPGVEKPSDMDGIAYITFDDDRAWKTELLRELEHAGFDIHQ